MKYIKMITAVIILFGLAGCSKTPKAEQVIEQKLQKTSFNPGPRPKSCMYRANWTDIFQRAREKTCNEMPNECSNGMSRRADDRFKFYIKEEVEVKEAINGNCKLYDYQIEQFLKQQSGVS